MTDLLPFSAVVGQEEAKLALLLAACDRGVGGVLLRGEKGSAKTTLARGLSALLPGDAPFVELPVGATEDRVVGTLDLTAALTGGQKRFDPGLLANADGGVLYVDEINLLPDHLVDVLLDVAASGVNRVEREGISHSHPSRFLLIGSMNPEEGDLRPQLLDRFGLAVDIRSFGDPGLRAEAVRRRLEFDADRPSVVATFAPRDGELAARLQRSRPAPVPDSIVGAVAGICAEMGAEGLRADLTICRAAGALAGWEGREEADSHDVRRVAHLALAHRARRDPLDPSGLDRRRLDEAMARHFEGSDPAGAGGTDAAAPPGTDVDVSGDDRARRPAGPSDSGGSGGDAERSSEVRGSTSGPGQQPDPWQDRTAPAPEAPEPVDAGGSPNPGALRFEGTDPSRLRPLVAPDRGSRKDVESDRGRIIGDRAPSGPIGSVAVGATIRSAAARLSGSPIPSAARGSELSLVEPGDLRESVRSVRRASLVVLAVDASGSMGARQRMEVARSAVLGMLRDAYQRRDLVALVGFRDSGAQVLLNPTGSVEVAKARLASLTTGGRTPLGEGLRSALRVALSPTRAASHVPLVVLVTDGRATSDPRGGNPVEAALSAAAEIARAKVASVVIDVEGTEGGPGRPHLGLAREVALAMGARYFRALELTADLIQGAAGHGRAGPSAAATSIHPRGATSRTTWPESTTTNQGDPGTA